MTAPGDLQTISSDRSGSQAYRANGNTSGSGNGRPEWRRRSYGAWRFLWGDEPSESLAELDALLERDLPGAHGGARALLERWWAEFEIAERGTPTRRAG